MVEILARALHEVHRHDIVHRDLKPSNILLSAVPPSSGNTFSTPKVTDFGLAKQLGVQAGPTKKGAILGTPIYMAPEQARGGTDGIGAAADIYALGAVLYELLSARPPFQAKTMWETLQQVRCAEPVPPSQLQPDVPGGLEAICLRCLRKQPHDRYPSAEALADELARFLAARAV